MVDAVASWALPGTLSLIPADVLLAVVGGLMCEYQVRRVTSSTGLLPPMAPSRLVSIEPVINRNMKYCAYHRCAAAQLLFQSSSPLHKLPGGFALAFQQHRDFSENPRRGRSVGRALDLAKPASQSCGVTTVLVHSDVVAPKYFVCKLVQPKGRFDTGAFFTTKYIPRTEYKLAFTANSIHTPSGDRCEREFGTPFFGRSRPRGADPAPPVGAPPGSSDAGGHGRGAVGPGAVPHR